MKMFKRREIKERVVNIEKPEAAKIIKIYFADGSEFYPYTNGLNDKLEIGDSLYKRQNQWYYVIYKKANPLDSIVYSWQDQGGR